MPLDDAYNGTPSIPVGTLRIAIERAAAEKTLYENKDLAVRGLPGVETLRISRADLDNDPGLVVTHINGELSARPMRINTDVVINVTTVRAEDAKAEVRRLERNAAKRRRRAKQRQAVVRIDDTTWTLVDVEDTVRHKEPIDTDANGRDVLSAVDVVKFAYRMTCPCGRCRYAKPNSLFEVSRCRVCSKQEKLRRKRESKNTRSKS